jgi:hypothetical protein
MNGAAVDPVAADIYHALALYLRAMALLAASLALVAVPGLL